MPKTDKELAAEITVSVINSNPTVIDSAANVAYSMSLADVQSFYKGIFETIHSLKD